MSLPPEVNSRPHPANYSGISSAFIESMWHSSAELGCMTAYSDLDYTHSASAVKLFSGRVLDNNIIPLSRTNSFDNSFATAILQ